MRSRALPAFGLSVVALAVATSLSPMASAAAPGPSAGTTGGSTAAVQSTAAMCGGNMGTPNGDGITSQNFEAAYDAYDAMGGADFKINGKCKVTSVDLVGSFSAAGPADGATITIHKKSLNKPAKCEGTVEAAGPNFTVPVSGCKLKKGTYWLTAQGNLDFATGGQWYWSTTNEASGKPDQWQNPGDGFATGCTSWGPVGECLPYPGYEFLFSVNGKK
jgi:hypothetical protein